MKIVACSNASSFVDSLNNFNKKDIINTSISNFDDKEILVSIEDQAQLKNEDVLVVQSLSNNINDNIMELLFTLDIIRLSAPKSVRLLFTYMAYSRQDVNRNIKEAFSAKVIARLFSMDFISKIYVVDMHAEQTIGFFARPAYNILVDDLVVDLIKKKFKPSNTVIVTPNPHNLKKVVDLSEKLGTDYAVAIKYRPEANENKILSIIGGEVAEKDCIILDDLLDSGGVILNVSERLAKQGANTINAIVTHGIFSDKSLERIKKSYISKIFVANTINSEEKIKYLKQIETFSCSDYVINKILND